VSEYQYYDFRAVDRTLNEAEQKQLRAVSSRADITKRSFTNHYEWGDFKGSPAQFMERYFDLFLYLANWGSRHFSVRLPKQLVDAADLKRFFRGEEASLRVKGQHVIVDVIRNDIELDDDWDDGRGRLDELAPMRDAALDGDLRVFYLAWLMGVETGEVPDEEREPLPGIAPLTPALEAFADFFYMNADLVAAAAESPPAPSLGEPSRAHIVAAIEALDAREKSALLLRLYDGDTHLRGELRRRCRGNGDHSASRAALRTAADLRAIAARVAEERQRAEEARLEAEKRRKERKAAAALRQRLDALEKREEAAWREVESIIQIRNAPAYEKATALLSDLRELALRHDTDGEFHHRLLAIRDRHSSKPRFLERLVAAGLD
jgi:hypothetical protein